MSATPPTGLRDIFVDESKEPRDPKHPLGRRQLASKPAKLIDIERTTDIAKEMVDSAIQLANDEPKAIVVFVNRVATARKVRELLAKKGSTMNC